MAKQQKFLTVSDGSMIYYEIYGTGFPLILLHGNNDTGRYFHEQIQTFAKYFQVIVLDSRGHGRSTNLAPKLTFALMAKDLKEILDAEDIHTANILGFSDGANFAMKFAALFPCYIHRLVLNAGNTKVSGMLPLVVVLTYVQYGLYRLLSVASPHFKKKALIVELMVQDIEVSQDDLKRIQVPVLVIVGSHDVIRRAHSLYLSKTIPHARFVSIPKQGHLLAQTNAPRFNQEVLSFLLEKKVGNHEKSSRVG